MKTGESLHDPLRAYLDMRRGLLTNRELVRRAQDRLLDAEVPAWIEELAILRPLETLEARDVLESHLERHGILPDSRQLRLYIRNAVLEWADRAAESGVVETNLVVPAVVELLRLCPGYELSDVSIPIVEFPYPPSGVLNAWELAAYIKSNIEKLVPTCF